MSYGQRIDDVIYSQPTRDFARREWIRLALAALDQANISPRELAEAFQHARGLIIPTLIELDEE